MAQDFISYPRTPHMQGSGLQTGDSDRDIIPLSWLNGRYITIEEKIDGCNSGFSFDEGCDGFLQSRGHYLDRSRSVYRERHFNHLKSWFSMHESDFLERLEDRYITFGEYMGAVHSVFYDALPHVFLEFDVWDRQESAFLSTRARRDLLKGLPIAPVPVLFEGVWSKGDELMDYVRPSLFQTTDWQNNLQRACSMVGDDFEKRLPRLFKGPMSEGLYIKVEDENHVTHRMKFVHPTFVQTILDANVHWQSQIFVPNLLGTPIIGLPDNLVRDPTVSMPEYNADAPHEWGQAKDALNSRMPAPRP